MTSVCYDIMNQFYNFFYDNIRYVTLCGISLAGHTPQPKREEVSGDHLYSELFQCNNLVHNQSDLPFSVLGITS